VPTYEYRCTGCAHRYETHEGFDSPARQPCPLCGEMAKRILFPPPVVFKGSGFYSTDSRKGSTATIGMNADAKGGDGDSKGDTAKSGDGAKSDGSSKSGDSKPASTATTSSNAASSSD
jgi:putative FmdB family regulatory protein